MQTLLATTLALATAGCGSIFNGPTATIVAPPGSYIDGYPVQGPVMLNQQHAHELVYPNGGRCVIESRVSAGYVVADIVVFVVLGLLVDAITGDWHVLDAGSCPGVIVS